MHPLSRRLSPLAVIAACLCVFPSALALPPPAPKVPRPEPFRSGDRWAAVGDSITHGGAYLRSVYLFHVLRRPDHPFDLMNAGLSGDTAAGALRRLDRDILLGKPTAATVMLGMNDIDLGLYQPGGSMSAQIARIDACTANLKTLVQKLQRHGVRVTLLSSSPYDQTAVIAGAGEPAAAGDVGPNGGLRILSRRVRKLATALGCAYIDVHGPLTRINREAQRLDPGFTLIGRDRVHPGESGHLVIAAQILEAQGFGPLVARIGVNAQSQRAEECVDSQVSELEVGADRVAFVGAEKCLPFPVPPAARRGAELAQFNLVLNEEILRVRHLAAGEWALEIDGQPCGRFDAAALAEGVNLATIDATPQRRQAEAVAALADRRHTLESGSLRTIALVESLVRGAATGDVDYAAGAAAIARTNASAYLRDLAEQYPTLKANQAQTVGEVAAVTAEMWRTARPAPHRFVLQRVTR